MAVLHGITVKVDIKKVSTTMRLAVEIADDDARSIIDCNCATIRDSINRFRWYELRPFDLSDFYVDRAIRYLELRGKLKRNPKNPNQLKVLA
jgi:hypothetical protein